MTDNREHLRTLSLRRLRRAQNAQRDAAGEMQSALADLAFLDRVEGPIGETIVWDSVARRYREADA